MMFNDHINDGFLMVTDTWCSPYESPVRIRLQAKLGLVGKYHTKPTVVVSTKHALYSRLIASYSELQGEKISWTSIRSDLSDTLSCISADGIGRLHTINETLNVIKYIDIIPEHKLLPSIRDLFTNNASFIFQQDSTPCHTVKAAAKFFPKLRRGFIAYSIKTSWEIFGARVAILSNQLKKRTRLCRLGIVFILEHLYSPMRRSNSASEVLRGESSRKCKGSSMSVTRVRSEFEARRSSICWSKLDQDDIGYKDW
ncbi:UNVERIFIED_CONTAM: hypothetical protein NCL1_40940 [Trichonephila clavipes]